MRFLIGFFLYVFIEAFVTAAVASFIGWLAVFVLFVAGLIGGLLIMQAAGTSAAASLRDSSRTGQLPAGDVGDSALLFLGGALIAIPGFVTDVAGLLLTIPFVRRFTRARTGAAFSRAMRRRGMSVVTTNVDGVNVTRVVPGDVVVGDVIKREDDLDDPKDGPPTGSRDPNDPPMQLPPA